MLKNQRIKTNISSDFLRREHHVSSPNDTQHQHRQIKATYQRIPPLLTPLVPSHNVTRLPQTHQRKISLPRTLQTVRTGLASVPFELLLPTHVSTLSLNRIFWRRLLLDRNEFSPTFFQGRNLVLLVLLKFLHPERSFSVFVELHAPNLRDPQGFFKSGILHS